MTWHEIDLIEMDMLFSFFIDGKIPSYRCGLADNTCAVDFTCLRRLVRSEWAQ